MQATLRLVLRSGFLLALLWLVAGCESTSSHTYGCTHALWTTSQLVDYSSPANPPALKLFHAKSKQDIVVQYDEVDEKNDAIHRRAYLLFANQQALRASKSPAYLDLSKMGELEPVRISQESPFGPESSKAEFCAVLAESGQGFSLYRQGTNAGAYDLPVYLQTHHVATRVALTPLAIVGDASIVGFFVAYLCASTKPYGPLY